MSERGKKERKKKNNNNDLNRPHKHTKKKTHIARESTSHTGTGPTRQ